MLQTYFYFSQYLLKLVEYIHLSVQLIWIRICSFPDVVYYHIEKATVNGRMASTMTLIQSRSVRMAIKERELAGNLAKAREVRKAKASAKKPVAAKAKNTAKNKV